MLLLITRFQIFSEIYHLDEGRQLLLPARYAVFRLIKESPMPEPSHTHHQSYAHGSQRFSRTVVCPKCGSPNIDTKNHAKRIGGAIGTCAGVMGSLSGATEGASVGAVMAFRASAPAAPLVSITAAVLGALAGGAIGCASGAALGQVIDDTVLNNYLCLHCGHSFPTP